MGDGSHCAAAGSAASMRGRSTCRSWPDSAAGYGRTARYSKSQYHPTDWLSYTQSRRVWHATSRSRICSARCQTPCWRDTFRHEGCSPISISRACRRGRRVRSSRRGGYAGPPSQAVGGGVTADLRHELRAGWQAILDEAGWQFGKDTDDYVTFSEQRARPSPCAFGVAALGSREINPTRAISRS